MEILQADGGVRVTRWVVAALLPGLAACAIKAPVDPAVAETQLEVDELALIGVESIAEEQLREVLQTKPSAWWPWATDHVFDREAFADDLERIDAFYADHGFPDARVISHEIDVNRAAGAVDISVRVHEGEPVVVAGVVLAGFEPLTETEQAELLGRMPLSTGEPIVHVEVVTSGEMAANALRDRGHPYAEVSITQDPVDSRARRIEFAATPGPRAWFGPIEIVGNVSVDDEIIRRELAYRPGELFQRHLLQESHRRLYTLGLFRFANIEAVNVEAQPSEVRTRVTVAEGEHIQVQFSLGYGTEEKLRADFTWSHVNFLGAARTLSARTAWSSLNRGAELQFHQPYLLHPRLSLELDGHAWKRTEPAYDLTTRGGHVRVLGEVDEFTGWSVALVGEDHSSRVSPRALDDPSLHDELIALGLDPETGRQGGLLSALALTAERDTSRNPLDPQQGYQVSVHLEQAGSWLPGAFDFVEWQIGGRYYWPILGRAVIASRLTVATIDPSGTSAELPFAQRYFLGGSTSLRGWGRYEVSPLTSNGLPLGGKSMIDSSVEARIPISGNFGTAVFVDAGNVWRNEWQFDLADLRADAGVGLRYQTPVGPLRVDVAWQLTPIANLRTDGELSTRRWRIHFSIGQAF